MAFSLDERQTGFSPGFRNWVPIIGNSKISRFPIFQWRSQFTLITAINMYLLYEIKHNVHIQCSGNYIDEKKVQI